MRFSFRRWRPRALLLAWSAYWLGLAAIVTASISEAGRTTWSGSMSLLNIALLVALPPLLLWLVWLAGSSRTNNADEIALKKQTRPSELKATEPGIGIVDTSTSKRRAREES